MVLANKWRGAALLAVLTCNAACISSRDISVSPGGDAAVWLDDVTLRDPGQTIAHVRLVADNATALEGVGVAFSAAGCTFEPASAQTAASGEAQATASCTGAGGHDVTARLTRDHFTQTLSRSANLYLYEPTTDTGGLSLGEAINVAVLAPDAGYRGTVQFSSDDPNATLPHAYTFDGSELGYKEFIGGLTWQSPGNHTVQAADANTGALLGSQGFTVTASPVVELRISDVPANATAGVQVTVSAINRLGVVANDYRGTVDIHTTDTAVTPPGAYSFTASDGGVHSFHLHLTTAGTQSISATDGNLPLQGATATKSIDVAAAAGSQLAISAPSATRAGDEFAVTITLRDAFGNLVQGTSSVQLSGSDPNGAFSAATWAQGAGQATATLYRSGAQTLTARDTTHALASATATVTVAAGPTQRLALQLPAQVVAGVPLSPNVLALDSYGNLASDYGGSVRMIGSDAGATFPGRYLFSTLDAGHHTFVNALSLAAAGQTVLQVADVLTPAIQGSATILVTPGAPFGLSLSALPANVVAGNPTAVTIGVVDMFGNATQGYTGTMHFASNDIHAQLPPNTPFAGDTNGLMTLTGQTVFKSAGNRQMTVSDTTALPLLASIGTTNVLPAEANTMTVTGLTSPVSHQLAQTVTVTLTDPYGNLATNQSPSAHFGSTDLAAMLPADAPIAAGTQTFSVTFETVGSQSLTVTDANGLSTTVGPFIVQHFCAPFGHSTYFGTTSYTYNGPLALDANNNPWVTWFSDVSNTPQIYGERFDGSVWQPFFPTSASGLGISRVNSATCPNINLGAVATTIDANQRPAVAYALACNANSVTTQGLMVVSFDGSTASGLAGSATYPGIWTNPNVTYASPRVQRSSRGTVFALYNQGVNLSLVTFDGNAWTGMGNVPQVTTVANPEHGRLTVDGNDRPYVVYDAWDAGQYETYLTYWNGATWAQLAGSNSGGGLSQNAGASKSPSIALDLQGLPVVSWLDDTSGPANAYVVRWTGLAWQSVGPNPGGGSSISGALSPLLQAEARVDGLGNIWLAWSADQNSNGSVNLYARRWSGSGWADVYGSSTGLGISQMSGVGGMFDFDVAVGSDNRPVFTFAMWFGGAGQACRW